MAKNIVNIEIVDSGKDKYLLSPKPLVLGRQYENNATEIQITKPEIEQENDCFLVATNQYGELIDHIEMTDNKCTITNNLSKHKRIFIGFYFSGENDYVKGSEIVGCDFLPSQKPDDYVEVEPEQKKNLSYLIDYGFTDSKLVDNELQFFNANGDKVVAFDLSPFTQEQSDWVETDSTKETYIKNKPTLSKVANSGDYNDLSNTPTLSAVASTGDYNDLGNKPNLSAVATSGDYNDLNNKPTVSATPTKTSDLENDSDFVVASEENTYSAKQNFSAETEFNGVAEHNADINVNDNTLNITNSTSDTVTKYGTDKITQERGQGETKIQINLTFPAKSGVLVTDKDIENIKETIAEALRDNLTQIVDTENNFYAGGAIKSADDKYDIAIGPNAKPNGTGNITIGPNAQNQLNATGAVLVGGYCSTVSNDTINIGHNARTEAVEAIQLGTGTNSTAKSLQILTDNIYKVATKTLTVANAQIDGNDSYGIIKGSGSPAVTTVGKEGQQYLDITNNTLWVCLEATASGVYTWKQVQEKITQYSGTVAEEVQTIKIGNLLIQYELFTNVAGNSEKTLSFPTTFTSVPFPLYSSTAPGQSVSNSIGLVNITQDYITVRICGSASNIIIGAIGFIND